MYYYPNLCYSALMGKKGGRRRLTEKEKRFADLWLKNGHNGTRAALAVYDSKSPKVAGITAARALARDRVMAYIQGCAEIAAENVFELANAAKNEQVRLAANKDILDRSGFKAAEKHESVVLHAHANSERVAQLAAEVALRLSERKLVEPSE